MKTAKVFSGIIKCINSGSCIFKILFKHRVPFIEVLAANGLILEFLIFWKGLSTSFIVCNFQSLRSKLFSVFGRGTQYFLNL